MNVFDIFDIISYIFFSFIFIPIGVAIYRRRYLATPDKYILAFLLGYLLLSIIAATLLYNQQRNHFLYYFQTILAVILSYYLFIETNYLSKKQILTLKIASVSIILLMFIEITFIGFNKINSVTLALSRTFMCVLSLVYLRQETKNIKLSFFDLKSTFWYQVGNFIFSFFSIFTSLFKNYFIETSLDLYLFFDTISILSIAVAFTVYAFGLGITKKIR